MMPEVIHLNSSARSDWETPENIFSPLNRVFNFDLDACASQDNSKAERFFDSNKDCISIDDWDADNVWMNPPYLKKKKGQYCTDDFLFKGNEQILKKNIRKNLCILVNNSTEKPSFMFTNWKAVIFFKSRIRFVNPVTKLPQGSPTKGNMVLIYSNEDNYRMCDNFNWIAKMLKEDNYPNFNGVLLRR